MNDQNSRFIVAQYPGACRRCGTPYVAGQKIVWHFSEKLGAHLHCPAEDLAALAEQLEHAWLGCGWFSNDAGVVALVERSFDEYVVTVWAPGHGLLIERVPMTRDTIEAKWHRLAHRPDALPGDVYGPLQVPG